MTTFVRALRSSVFAIGLAGCSQQQAADAPAGPPAVVIAPQPADAPAGEPKAQPGAAPSPKPEPPPPTFAFPADQTGVALARVMAPDVTRPLPAERFGIAPLPRPVPPKVLEPDAAERARYVPPPLLPPKPVSARPAQPPERVPLDLGARADDVPAKPKLPVAPVVTPRARDVNRPPPAPVLGRPLTERVGLDDPTGELGNAVVVSGVVRVPPAPSGFVKVSVPDPFELAEQVKPRIPAPAEPSAAPVPVNPHRVK